MKMFVWLGFFLKRPTFPFSYHNKAWFRERTLQSYIALFGAGLARATERPILIGSCTEICLSWNGWEFGRGDNIARADMLQLDVARFVTWPHTLFYFWMNSISPAVQQELSMLHACPTGDISSYIACAPLMTKTFWQTPAKSSTVLESVIN